MSITPTAGPAAAPQGEPEPKLAEAAQAETTAAPPAPAEPSSGQESTVEVQPAVADRPGRVPGCGGFDLQTAIVVAGIEWIPADGLPHMSPIGTALAAEMAASA
ncbi:hypothetical protein [Pseudonocardia zijingensis]